MDDRAVRPDHMVDHAAGRHEGIAGHGPFRNHPVPERIGILRTEPVAEGIAVAAKLRRARLDPDLARIGVEPEVVAANCVVLPIAG